MHQARQLLLAAVSAVFLTPSVVEAIECYRDSLLPDGKVPASRCQNNVFEKGRSLYCIHQPVMDVMTVEGLGTWKKGKTGSEDELFHFTVISLYKATGECSTTSN